MNVLYCGDKNIIDGLFISILSLLKNVPDELKIYVFTITLKNESYNIEGLNKNSINYLDKKVKEKNPNNFVKRIDITELFKKEILESNMETRFTPCCMLRLYADLVDDLPDKILYLDYDVICRKNCLDFYNQNIDDYEIVGVLDHYGKWFFKKKPFKFDYINSGVLLLNLKKIKETKLFENARNLCKTEKMFMPDQSSINKLAIYKKLEPRKFNEQRKLHKDTVFHHFTTSFRFFPWIHTFTVKPWQIDDIHKKLKIFEYDDIFDIYTKEINDINKIKIMEDNNK